MKKRYVFGLLILLLAGILTWWVLPGTPHKSQSGTNTNAADKDLQAFYQVLETDYPHIYERLADQGKTTYTIPGLTQTPSVLAQGQTAGEEDEAGDMTPQGLAFVDDQVILSQSYGNKDSKLLYFDLGDQEKLSQLTVDQAVAELATPAYMQQILAEGDFIYLLFESSATQYRLDPTVTSIDRVIKIRK